MDKTPMQFTPMPVIDPDLDIYDVVAVQKAKFHWFKEQDIRLAEFHVLRDKLRWCFRRSGVNHMHECRAYAQQFLAVLKEHREHGFAKPFKIPYENYKRNPDGSFDYAEFNERAKENKQHHH